MAYSEELCLKEFMFADFLVQKNRDVLTVYLSCWLHEPCLNSLVVDKVEALVTEAGLRY